MAEKKNLPHNHGRINFIIEDSLPDDAAINGVSDAMKQLGDPTRLRIFWYLCHTEECVLDIAAAVNMTSPAISHHLRLLKAAGLITSRREGYKASDSDLAQTLHKMIEDIAEITCPE